MEEIFPEGTEKMAKEFKTNIDHLLVEIPALKEGFKAGKN